MNTRHTLLGAMLLFSVAATAQVKTVVTTFASAGPYEVARPYMADSISVKGKAFAEADLLSSLSLDAPLTGTFTGEELAGGEKTVVGLLTFYINNADYLSGRLDVSGPKHCQVYVDGQETKQLRLAPAHHTVAIKYAVEQGRSDSLHVVIDAPRQVSVTAEARHPYTLHDLTDGRRVRSVSLSPDGTLVAVAFQTTQPDGKSQWAYELRQTADGRLVRTLPAAVRWMPRSNAYIEELAENGSRTLYRTDPRSGERRLLARGVPRGHFEMSPTEDFLILSVEEEGPKEDRDIFEVTEMDDRQPGFRSRRQLVRYDLATGVAAPLTFGHRSAHLSDISADGRLFLVSISRSRLERRPTTVTDLLVVDAQTLRADTLVSEGEFIGGAQFSPDASQVLISGSPEAFARIGCQLPETVCPNMMEGELFLMDRATRRVTALTLDFDPSVGQTVWSVADGQIYFTAETRDYVYMYTLNPRTRAITRLPLAGDNIYRYDMASRAAAVAYLSYKTMEPASAYVTRRPLAAQQTLLFDGREALGDAVVGTCSDWNFLSERGDSVYGRLYLPADFDPSKQYPLIVYYYGGCSPVSRYFESPYAPQMWNSLGYVAYILQPSGCTGFGQEWASRHVNTAGRGPADDIIEGVKRLCDAHPYINKEKIGCMGASYGGFMTQYLQTQTNLFACAVSHAGIANHTSYWGEGYWGYNYSEVSMAGSYPWSDRELYVDQSPLFNADKIHTPLLLLHGNADTNVPLVESLQMFTALKLLGREVALVEVEGENHHILDYGKKHKWVATQMAWFQRWLKDDPSWWDALYPKKNL